MKHLFKEHPMCPHCDHKIKNHWDHEGIADDNEEHELECPECEEKFFVETTITYVFTSRKGHCWGEHEWGESLKHVIDEKICERWNKEGFLNKRDWTPHANWSRQCVKCDYQTFFRNASSTDVPIDSTDPWEGEK